MSKQDGSGRQVTNSALDDPSATILHVDMDAFFASVELLERPDLRGLPVIVGGTAGRGVVTAATYEARKFGVNSAMPMSVALRRCPNAIVLPPHFDRYRHFSQRVMTIFHELTPLVEPLSIDEAFLEVGGARKLLGTPWEIGTELRRRVHAETGLRCSVGIAATKFIAKLASGRAKPDGLLLIPLADTLAFLHPLPISALWGVGAKTEERLIRLGMRTVGDVAHTPESTLSRALGDGLGRKLHELSWARDPRRVTTRSEEKSVGHETTFPHDVTDAVVIRRELLGMSDQVAVRLRRAGLQGRTVVLKLRYGDFTTITRSKTLAEPTDVARRIYDEVSALFTAVATGSERIRLVGVRMEQLSPGGSGGPGLWDDDEDWRDAEQAVDAVARRFGRGLVRPAALVRPPVRDPRPGVAESGVAESGAGR
ncbi:DNA polymerase IV [Galbitalea soli]|uniref:DNA polymerase IV n=1 Tax=Galbitalea soli TaxID=1268042 RepID=A0A7C9TQ94_9MICO|nr:DNA polymerase IV [Galbitalea soli]NYJ30831.1 DNA polymerase-4 [Galbitalea soli]